MYFGEDGAGPAEVLGEVQAQLLGAYAFIQVTAEGWQLGVTIWDICGRPPQARGSLWLSVMQHAPHVVPRILCCRIGRPRRLPSTVPCRCAAASALPHLW